MSKIMFSSEVELAKFLGSIDIIPDAYRAISETILEKNLAYELHTTHSGHNVLAFKCSPDYTNRFLNGEFGLVPCENLELLDIISTKLSTNPAVELFKELGENLRKLDSSFSVNGDVVWLFQQLSEDLRKLKFSSSKNKDAINLFQQLAENPILLDSQSSINNSIVKLFNFKQFGANLKKLEYSFFITKPVVEIFQKLGDDLRELNSSSVIVEVFKKLGDELIKLNSSFYINNAAVELFQQLGDDLNELEKKHINTSLIITGSSLGGYLATLYTLRLHHAIDVEESNGNNKTKRPICITFGCPLVGDAVLQRAIAERPRWKSSILNVVVKRDPVASFLSSNTLYKPLGTFLFCAESGGHAAFEDQDSIKSVLDVIKSSNEGNSQIYDYTNVLSSIRKKVMYRGAPELGEFNSNSLRARITLQLKEVGVLKNITNGQIGEMEKKHSNLIRRKNVVSAYDPSKKLNEMKISLTYMEWYMKSRKSTGGYYDSYKNPRTKEEIESTQKIVVHQRRLNQYWEKTVEEKDKMPQKEGAKLRKRWLLGGSNYRKIVEPLDIAEYYKKGGIDYINNRSNHFKLLETWFDEDKKVLESSEVRRSKAASLTEDSCFWARVEEALRDLANGGTIDAEENFEAYLMGEIENYSVSPDIFLPGSSLMTWWDKYKAHKGSAYASEFAHYMNNKSYRSYQ